MCYKIVYSYTLRNKINNKIIKLNPEPKVIDNLYKAALEFSKNDKNDTFILFAQIKNEPCWKSEAACYKSYIDFNNFENDVETEWDYEETYELQNGEWIDEF